MPEKLDTETRLAKLKALGLSDKYGPLVALANAEREADAEIAKVEAARAAERETAARLRTPIEFTLPTVPEAGDDIVIIQMDRRPTMYHATIDGQVYAPRLGRGPISFLPRRFADALDRRQPSGWFWTSVARVAALDELLGPQDFRTVVNAATSETIPVLIAGHRRLAGRSGTQAKSLLALVDGALNVLSHQTSGPVQPSARAEHDSEAAADRILSLGGPIAIAAPTEEDPIATQISETNEQLNRANDQFSAKADRDAARAAFREAEEDAKLRAAIQAATP
jgi:hypothetical protein